MAAPILLSLRGRLWRISQAAYRQQPVLRGIYDMPKATLCKLPLEGRISGQKIGRHWRFHKAAIDTWLGQHAGNARKRKAK